MLSVTSTILIILVVFFGFSMEVHVFYLIGLNRIHALLFYLIDYFSSSSR